MTASSSKRTKIFTLSERNATPTGWISDDEDREKLIHGSIKVVVTLRYLDLSLFEREGFMFVGWLKTRELSSLVQLKGCWYPDLVRIFYHNLKLENGDIHSRVKGVDILICNDTWEQVIGLKAEGVSPLLPTSEENVLLKKKEIYKGWLRPSDNHLDEKLLLY